MKPNSLQIEERADDILTSAHCQNLRQIVNLEEKRFVLESLKNPTIYDRLKIVKLYFTAELSICNLIHKVKNETENGLNYLDDNQREKNEFQKILNSCSALNIVKDETKIINFLSEIENKLN